MANLLLDQYKQRLSQNNLSKYNDDIYSSVVGGNNSVTIMVRPPLRFINDGRSGRNTNPSAKNPPLGVISEWLSRKGIVSNTVKPKQLSYLVSRAIGERGTRGKKVLDGKPNLDEIKTLIAQEYSTEIKLAIYGE